MSSLAAPNEFNVVAAMVNRPTEFAAYARNAMLSALSTLEGLCPVIGLVCVNTTVCTMQTLTASEFAACVANLPPPLPAKKKAGFSVLDGVFIGLGALVLVVVVAVVAIRVRKTTEYRTELQQLLN